MKKVMMINNKENVFKNKFDWKNLITLSILFQNVPKNELEIRWALFDKLGMYKVI